jgi:hypothetical protein
LLYSQISPAESSTTPCKRVIKVNTHVMVIWIIYMYMHIAKWEKEWACVQQLTRGEVTVEKKCVHNFPFGLSPNKVARSSSSESF